MDTKKKALIVIALLASHGAAGGAGFFVYWKWFRPDTRFLTEQKSQIKQLDDFDAALERGQALPSPDGAVGLTYLMDAKKESVRTLVANVANGVQTYAVVRRRLPKDLAEIVEAKYIKTRL